MSDDNFMGMQESFISHLVELRDRLVKACAGDCDCLYRLFAWPGIRRFTIFLQSPMIEAFTDRSEDDCDRRDLTLLGADESDFTRRLCGRLALGLVSSLEVIAPGLYTHEKRLIAPLVISSSVLFAAGVAFCYFFCFGRVFKFISRVCADFDYRRS